MKLPIAQLKGLKLKNIKPLSRLSGKLPKVKLSDVVMSGNDSKGSQLAFKLLLVHPWVLVAGLWIVSLLGAAVAWEGMISPRKLTQALPEPAAQVAPVATNNFIDVEQRSDEIVTEEAAGADSSVQPGVTAVKDSSSFPAWPLGMMVGTCAAGCLVISRRRAMLRLSAVRARNAARGRVRKPRPAEMTRQTGKLGQKVAVQKMTKRAIAPQSGKVASKVIGKAANRVNASSAAAKSAVALMSGRGVAPAKKRRQRSTRPTVMAAKPATTKRVLVSRSSAQADARSTVRPKAQSGHRSNHVPQATPSSRLVQEPAQSRRVRSARRAAASRVASRQSVVSVVPANAAHRLDWPDGSLAHQMDVRPQRTAM
ncbi:MAG: hypothetical protein WA885_10515 [Phormidesmis sp.]